jgi:D-aminopeptidase
MKRAIICIFIFAALCALAAGSYIYIVNSTERLLNQVEFVALSFAEGDYAAVFTAAEQAEEMWREFRKRRFLIIDRDNVAEITAALARIRLFASEPSALQNDAKELLTETAVAAALLRQYLEHQRINFYNIL